MCCIVDIVYLESDCVDCGFLSEGIGVVDGMLLGIEVVVDMFVCISFEAVIISAVITFVFSCLLDIVYIVSSNSSYGVTILMTHALVVLYITDCLREKDTSSGSFVSE